MLSIVSSRRSIAVTLSFALTIVALQGHASLVETTWVGPYGTPTDPVDWDTVGAWSPVDPPDGNSHAQIDTVPNWSSGDIGIFDDNNTVGMLTLSGPFYPRLEIHENGSLHVLQDVNLTPEVMAVLQVWPNSSLTVNGSFYMGGTASGPSPASLIGSFVQPTLGASFKVDNDVVIWDGWISLIRSTFTASTVKLLDNGADNGRDPYIEIGSESTITADVVNEDGQLLSADGDINIQGNYLQEAGGSITVGSVYINSSLSSLGTITISGDVELNGGKLIVELDVLPTQPGSYDIIDSGALTGPLGWSDIIELPTLEGDLSWNLDRLDTDGIIRVVPEPASACVLLAMLAACRRRRGPGVANRTTGRPVRARVGLSRVPHDPDH